MVIAVAGNRVYGLADFYRKVWSVGDAGVPIPLTVLQGDKIQNITIPSADRYQEQRAKSRKDITL
jgi:S1-C subfamily serine protease